MVLSSAAMCLALNMFYEARNEGIIAQMLVAEVTMNRVEDYRFPNDICGVVWQKKQFSWTHDGKSDDPTKLGYPDRLVWEQIKELAQELTENPNVLPNTGATHYHATYVNPHWNKDPKIERVAKHKTHIFYRWRK